MEQSTTSSYYERNKEKIKARYTEKKQELIKYQMDYYTENIDRIVDYNAIHYRRNREKLLLKKSQKVSCLNCRRLVCQGQLTTHLKTRICINHDSQR
jgi:hypothetical protein